MVNGQIHIAVIDSGIAEALTGIHLYEDVLIRDKTLYKRDKDKTSDITHGTLCAAIIRKYAADSIMSSLCVLEEGGKGNIENLLTALHWCTENQVDIINMSMGSRYFQDKNRIRPAIGECVRKGIILVCAADNAGVITYPASMGNVIGVKSDNTGCLEAGEWMGIEEQARFDGIELAACANHSVKLGSGKTIECSGANSFAAPLVTGILARQMAAGRVKNTSDAKRWLAGNGKYPRDSFGVYHDMEWMEKITCLQISRTACEPDISEAVKRVLRSEADAVCLVYDSRQTEEERFNNIYDFGDERIIFFDSGKEEAYYLAPDRKKHFLYNLDYRLLEAGECWELSVPVIRITGRQEDTALISGILRGHFEAEGYSVLLCADFIMGALNGAVFMKRESMTRNVLAKLSYIRMAGIIIILSEQRYRL